MACGTDFNQIKMKPNKLWVIPKAWTKNSCDCSRFKITLEHPTFYEQVVEWESSISHEKGIFHYRPPDVDKGNNKKEAPTHKVEPEATEKNQQESSFRDQIRNWLRNIP